MSETANRGEGRDDLTPLRLAVISTPRSGNTWVRMQLASLYGLEQLPAHFPTEVDWENLPRRCILQIHWYPVEPFLGRLARNGFQVLVLSRHPFDVLMSWLNLVYYKHADEVCPGDNACTECGIVGVFPSSNEFVEYVRGYYGRVLLCYSPAWWEWPGVLRARYEELIAAPEAVLGRLVRQIGQAPTSPLAEVVAAHSLRQMRAHPEVWRFQCWQGQSGLWRHLITAAAARAIRAGVPEPFDTLGYPCDPDESLTPERADYNWARVQLDSTRDHLARERQKRIRASRDVTATRDALEETRQSLLAERAAHSETRHDLVASAEVAAPSSGGRLRLGGIAGLSLRFLRVARHPAASSFNGPHSAVAPSAAGTPGRSEHSDVGR